MTERSTLTPSPLLGDVTAYAPPRAGAPIDLHLDGNEGAAPPPELLEAVSAEAMGVESLRRYPDASALERLLAEQVGVGPERVLVTAGADDAIERLLRATLAPGRELLLPVPTFGMIARYAKLTGATVREVPWTEGALPVEAMIAAGGERTAALAVVTPNSPTGLSATAEELRRLSEAFPRAVMLVDLVYTEFSDHDLTADALALPNVVITRSFSKAWGLAGLRVGWAAGNAEVLGWMRVTGHPYAVSSPSLRLAEARLRTGRDDMARFVRVVKAQRADLRRRLARLGASSLPSQGNFVLARFEDGAWLRDALAGLGIGVRLFPGKAYLEDRVRITVPGHDEDFGRLCRALETVLAPERLVVDRKGSPAEAPTPSRLPVAEVDDAVEHALLAEPRTWLVTTRPEAVESARRAGALPLGLATDAALAEALVRAGAARSYDTFQSIVKRWRGGADVE